MLLRLMLIAVLLLGGCSMESAINRLAGPEQRRFAEEVVADIRSGNEARLRQRIAPDIWEESRPLLARVRSFFPAGEGRTRLVGYHFNTQSSIGGAAQRRQQFVLVTEAPGRWAVTHLETFASGDAPARIVSWRVEPHDRPPPELAMLEASERMVPWLRALVVGFMLVVAAILVAFFRYRRRRRAELVGPPHSAFDGSADGDR